MCKVGLGGTLNMMENGLGTSVCRYKTMMESPVSHPLYLNIAMIRLFVYGQFTSHEAGPLPS
jgi:hypothetical protein